MATEWQAVTITNIERIVQGVVGPRLKGCMVTNRPPVETISDDPRRTVYELRLGALAIVEVKGPAVLGNHSHPWSEMVVMMAGRARLVSQDLDNAGQPQNSEGVVDCTGNVILPADKPHAFVFEQPASLTVFSSEPYDPERVKPVLLVPLAGEGAAAESPPA